MQADIVHADITPFTFATQMSGRHRGIPWLVDRGKFGLGGEFGEERHECKKQSPANKSRRSA